MSYRLVKPLAAKKEWTAQCWDAVVKCFAQSATCSREELVAAVDVVCPGMGQRFVRGRVRWGQLEQQ